MCGHVGYASATPTASDMSFFKQALYVDGLRGRDSTGIMSLNKEFEVEIYKNSLEAADFINTKKFDDYMTSHNDHPRLMLGHNRAATLGSIVDRNAHPFRHNHIIMAHNGSLWFHDNLHRGADFDVDSEAICYNLATKNAVDTLESLCGAYALVWFDTRSNTLKMARNTERPLTVAISADGKGIYWASEHGMLKFLLERNGIPVEEYYDIVPEVIHTFDINSEMIGHSYDLGEEFEDEKQVSYVPTYGGYGSTKKHSAATYDDRGYGYQPSYRRRSGLSLYKGDILNCEVTEIIPYSWTDGKEGTVVVDTWDEIPIWITDTDITEIKLGNILRVEVEKTDYYRSTGIIIGPVNILDVPFENDEEDLVVGYNNCLVTEKEWKEQTQDGCAWCTSTVSLHEAEAIEWLGPRSFLCPNCIAAADLFGGYLGYE